MAFERRQQSAGEPSRTAGAPPAGRTLPCSSGRTWDSLRSHSHFHLQPWPNRHSLRAPWLSPAFSLLHSTSPRKPENS